MSFKNQLIKTNYHTHMYLCRHATGSVDDYVAKAVELGFTELGMSDHAPWENLIDRSVRMHMDDYPVYLKELEEATVKYSGRIKIRKGLEIEYFQGMDNHYKRLLNDLDYLVLGQHYIEMDGQLVSTYRIHSIKELTIYKNTLVTAIKSGYFRFIAHPDLFLFSQIEISDEVLAIAEEIILAAKEAGIPLEINANGIRKGMIRVNNKFVYRYPREEFWNLVRIHNAKVIISSDAHNPDLLYDEAVIATVEFSEAHNLIVEEELEF